MTRHGVQAVMLAGAVAVAAAVAAPSGASTAPRTWTVHVGSSGERVVARYPQVEVPVDTGHMNVSLPTAFDWAPEDLAAPAPDVRWSVERAGDVVGSGADADEGVLAGFGSTGSIDVTALPTPLTVGTGYQLRLHATWSDAAPADAGDSLDLVTPFEVTAAEDGSDVAVELAFSHASTESRELTVPFSSRPAGGDRLVLDTTGAERAWSWSTGPDPSVPWIGAADVTAVLEASASDDDPLQSLGTVQVTTPSPFGLTVTLPGAVHSAARWLRFSASGSTDPSSGPNTTLVVHVPLSVSAGVPALRATSLPRITGTARYGYTLRVGRVGWTRTASGSWGTPAVTVTYQWYRGRTAIRGATGTSYRPTAADVGRYVSVRETGRSTGYQAATVGSRGVKIAPAPAPRVLRAPTISGTRRVGSRLTVNHGSWSLRPTRYAYQWLSNGRPITGARSATFTVPAWMVWHTISCKVTAVMPGHASGVARTSAAKVRPHL
ncbi:MAG: hypothetical protein GC157_07730 [Frankiales bacterium]|nr:hypothetical protein [Frankiales bacterium]